MIQQVHTISLLQPSRITTADAARKERASLTAVIGTISGMLPAKEGMPLPFETCLVEL